MQKCILLINRNVTDIDVVCGVDHVVPFPKLE